MPALALMIKPASGLCNMACKYCFYADESARREIKSYGIMSYGVLDKVLERVLSFAENTCTIAFQGGEPTLAGLEFFKEAVRLEKKYNVNGCRINNAIQTNGTLLDNEWAAFFKENNFLVGISLDGPKDINDENRIFPDGKSTYKKVMQTIQLLSKHGVDFNILSVVTSNSARSIRKVYGFFDRQNLQYQQYIPCLDPIGEERGGHAWSLSPDRFEAYLKNLFDCWYEDLKKGKIRYNRYFENLIMMISGQRPEACGMSGICSRQFVVEADGSVFPCDFYALDEWKLGNLAEESLESIEKRRSELRFIENSETLHDDCKSCKWKYLCRGGCKRDRELIGDSEIKKNYFCKSYYNFFEYAYPRLLKLTNASGNLEGN